MHTVCAYAKRLASAHECPLLLCASLWRAACDEFLQYHTYQLRRAPMRTFILVCLVAFIVAVGVAYAVGLVAISTEHADGRYVISFALNTDMIHSTEPRIHGGLDSTNEELLDVQGKVIAVRPEKNEFAVSENVKNWTFQLAKDGKVFINNREAKLAELKVGDEAMVTFNRQGPEMVATVVRG